MAPTHVGQRVESDLRKGPWRCQAVPSAPACLRSSRLWQRELCRGLAAASALGAVGVRR